MQQLNLNDDNIVDVEPKKGFWRRQFQTESTGAQKKFDWIFGVIMPVICFVFDPIVFKGGAILGTYKPFSYLLSFASVMAMSAWLIWGAKLKWLNAFSAGLFLVVGIISVGIGIILFPFSLMGLIILIGALGFTPLFSSIAFFRNSFRAFQTAKPFFEKEVLVRSFVLTIIFTAIVPAVINLEINKFIQDMNSSDIQTIRKNARTLKFLSPLTDTSEISKKYCQSPNNERREVWGEVYKQLTDETIYWCGQD